MNMKKFRWLIVAVAIDFSMTTTSHADNEQNSGFLGDYSTLIEVKDTAGDTVLRYVSPKLKPGAYQKVMIDPTQYYPSPKPTEQVTAPTLTRISAYIDKGLQDKLGAQGTLVSQPGPGVIRLRPAITAVAPKSPGLKPYEIIPIGFLISTVKGRDKEATIQIEVEVVDSMTGERLGASVRKGVGAKLESASAKLSLIDLQPLLNRWINTGTTFVAEFLK